MRARVSRAMSGISRSDACSRSSVREIELAVAPLQHAHAVEVVRLEPLDGVGVERLGLAGDAEGAVVHVAAGAAGDLAELAGVRSRWFWPSNLRVAANAT